jgi:hypothetical protein
MPLSFLEPPQPVTEATRSALQDMARQRHFRIAALAAAQPAQIDLASAHAVYNIGLEDLVRDVPLSSLPLTAWRYIVRSGGAGVAAAEAHSDPQGGAPRFDSVNSGPFVGGTLSAIESLSSDPAIAGGNWEARVIRIPALYILGIWAHEKASGRDIIRVMAPAPPYLDPAKSYGWEDFRSTVRGPAQQRLSFDDRPKP